MDFKVGDTVNLLDNSEYYVDGIIHPDHDNVFEVARVDLNMPFPVYIKPLGGSNLFLYPCLESELELIDPSN